MTFNEDSRVKIPALLHLTRLGYTYISRKEHGYREEATNIFKNIFIKSVGAINPKVNETDTNNERFDIDCYLFSFNVFRRRKLLEIGKELYFSHYFEFYYTDVFGPTNYYMMK
jgi:hypothetical protein